MLNKIITVDNLDLNFITPEFSYLELKNRNHWVLWKLVQIEEQTKKIPYSKVDIE